MVASEKRPAKRRKRPLSLLLLSRFDRMCMRSDVTRSDVTGERKKEKALSLSLSPLSLLLARSLLPPHKASDVHYGAQHKKERCVCFYGADNIDDEGQ